MKKTISFHLLLLVSVSLFSLEPVIAEKEQLIKIEIGKELGDANYSSNEEGFFSPGSPFIDQRGNIIFFSTINGKVFIKIENSQKTVLPYKGNLVDYRAMGNRMIHSQQGILLDGEPLLFNVTELLDYTHDKKTDYLRGRNYILYPAPFGAIKYSSDVKQGIAYVLDIKKPTDNFQIISNNQLKSWLPTQPGGFSIGDDGLLYRNGMVWSAIPPKDWRGAKFLGRLMSGHVIWAVGTLGMESWFIITDSNSNIEMQFYFPWKYVDGKETQAKFNYGVGPWGEMYCLLAPPSLNPETYYKPDPKYPAELVVVRNHLKYFGRLNDGGVRLRKEPNTSSEILGTYPAKTGFRIIERNGKEETIAGQKSDWVKVRLLDGKEGWFFGAFVHNLYDGPNGKPPPWPNVPDW